ncbi:MAG: hydrogenase expression/formation protein HypE [Pseudomonadota bacterium]
MSQEDHYISLAHGNGGRLMRELIESTFRQQLNRGQLDTDADAVPLALPPNLSEAEVVITTDSFTVKPLEFPGGDIGSLAVHGTVNDLSVAGAKPLYLTLNAIIEEGLELATLERLIRSLGKAADEAGVTVVAGDTKVVPRGEGSGLYLATTGVGIRDPKIKLGMDYIEVGDQIVVSGPVGDHGTAVMLAREEFGLSGELYSDNACVTPLFQSISHLSGLRFMRDPTRGGLATVCHEIARATGHTLRLHEEQIPVRAQVRSVCNILGYDPLFLACEGRVVAILSTEQAEEALHIWQQHPQGEGAAIIGAVTTSRGNDGEVTLKTKLGGERYLRELEEDPLPRIC